MGSYQTERKRFSCYFMDGTAIPFVANSEASLIDRGDYWEINLTHKDTVRVMKAGLAYIREQYFMENVKPKEDAGLPAAEAPERDPFPFR